MALLVFTDREIAARYLAQVGRCDGFGFTVGDAKPVSGSRLTIPAVGDASHACTYLFSTSVVTLQVAAASRNVVAEVGAAPLNPNDIRFSAGVDMAVAVVRRQIAIVDRLAPP